jgi:hypothetical protein
MSFAWKARYVVPTGRPVNARVATIARTASTIQFAVNLAGLAQDFAEVTAVLRDLAHEQDEQATWVNEHPISMLYAVKTAELTGACMPDLHLYQRALDWLRAVIVRVEKETHHGT